MKLCRDCDFWKQVGMWQGVCKKDYFTRPQMSGRAAPFLYGCTEYQDFRVQSYYKKVEMTDDEIEAMEA